MTADTVGGVWNYSLELARALRPAGVEVVLATMGASASATQREEAAEVGNVELHQSAFRLEWMQDPWEDIVRAGNWLLDLQGSVHPDIVHINGYALAGLAWQVPCVVVAHSCVLSWWHAVRGKPAPPSWRRYREAVAQGLARADAVIAPTRSMLDSVRDNHEIFFDGCVIPNCANPLLYKPGEKQPFILTAGRWWDDAKNLSALEAATNQLPWPCFAAGEGADGSRGAIRCLGKLPSESLAGYFSAASIYALPARYEPFGLSILEAAMSGCALVIGNIASLRELWQDAAIFVDPDDHTGLNQALQRLIRDSEEREELARRALERARGFTPERMAESYLDLYRRLLGREAQKETLTA